MVVVDGFKDEKTTAANDLLGALKLDRGILVVHDSENVLHKSFKNIPSVNVVNVSELNAYDVLRSRAVVMTSDALAKINSKFESKK